MQSTVETKCVTLNFEEYSRLYLRFIAKKNQSTKMFHHFVLKSLGHLCKIDEKEKKKERKKKKRERVNRIQTLLSNCYRFNVNLFV